MRLRFQVARLQQTPAQAFEAATEAVGAVRRKAELYAEEAGVRLGAILHIEDEDPDQVRGQYRSHSSARAEASEGDLTPGHVVVSAAVTLGFAIAHD
ncbi:MAG: SIMPL domain-containing protein [Trebonia sp.]